MSKDANSFGHDKALAWESRGFVYTKKRMHRFDTPSCFYWQYKFIKMSRNYFINVSIVSLCSIYQTIALIRDFNIDLQWGRYYVSLLLFFFIKKEF